VTTNENTPWTVRRIVAWMAQDFAARGVETARLDADLLVAHALGLDRVRLFLALDRELEPEELTRIRALVTRRRASEPVAYILGRKEFYGRTFVVSPAVLVPRPDTEALVERALALLPVASAAHVLDLCTGSGAIAVSLAAERPRLRVEATDLSPEALAVARQNVEANGLSERVVLRQGDLFAALAERRRFALITANPPYIPAGDARSLPRDVVAHEPHLALFAGADGLEVVRRLVAAAPDWLTPGGTLLVELGAGQADRALALARAEKRYVDARMWPDLAGIARVLEARTVGGEARAAMHAERVVVLDAATHADPDAVVGERVIVPEPEPQDGALEALEVLDAGAHAPGEARSDS
jgi:release factor glutamine methyltransferase